MTRLTRWLVKRIYGDKPDPQSLLLEKVDVPTMVESAKGWNRYGLAMAIDIGIILLCAFLLLAGFLYGMDYLGRLEHDLETSIRGIGAGLMGMWCGTIITISAFQTHLYRTADERYEHDMEEWMKDERKP